MATTTLPSEIESPLVEEARRQGTTPELLAFDTLRPGFTPPVAPPSEKPLESNLVDFLAGYVGLVDGSTETLDLRMLHATDG